MKRFAFLFFLPLMLWGQANWACNFKGSVTLAGAGPSFPNNTAAPQCNAFALTWSSTGFSGLTIELQGSDNNSSWTTFTGSSTVLVGTNPQSTLSGAIVVQASSTLAFIRVNVTSVTGTGSISYQIYGGNGILPSASAGGGGGGSCGTLGGDLSGTCTAATVVGVNGAAVPASATLTGTNSSKQIIAAALASGDFFVGSAGNLPVGVAMSGDATLSNIGALNVSGINGGTVPALTQPLATNSSSQIVAAVVQGNGSKVQLSTGSTTLNDCVKFDGNGNTVDSGGACGSGGSGGGGIVTYSSSADTLLGTQYLPPGGGAPLNSTESDNQVASGASATLSNFHVQVSAALGIGASAVFTWRDGGSSEPLTCTISGSVAVSCADTTHSFNVAAGDLIDVLVVTTGTPGVVNILFTAAFGTSNVGVTSVFGNSGPTVGATGDIGATGAVLGIDTVPLCTGFTPTNSQFLQYTTGSSPNPCYTAATASGGACMATTQTVVSSPVATVTFSSIPATCQDLIFTVSGRSSASANADSLYIQFNGDSGNNYQNVFQYATGVANAPGGNGPTQAAGKAQILQPPGASATANYSGFGTIEIDNYTNTTFYKQAMGLASTFVSNVANQSTAAILQFGIQWNNTSAITSATLGLGSGNFVAGTIITLKGRN